VMRSKTGAAGPTILIIFGISGDLSRRKLLPALAKIDKNAQLPEHFKLLGISRRQIHKKDVLRAASKSLSKYLSLFTMDLGDQSEYDKLAEKIKGLDNGRSAQIIFYFAVPPAATLPIIRHLGKAGLNHDRTKLLLEKPFGVDLESAQDLINQTDKYFKENQVYRIDHYLAKEMAQNIIVFIAGNSLYRNVWNNQFINSIEVIASESIDIEGRVGFYEQSGALRDIIQSHLLQLTALVLMNPLPSIFEFKDVPKRRLQALQQLSLLGEQDFYNNVIRAQYKGYRQEISNRDSLTETFTALKFESENERWRGVPIHLITGKSLERKFTEIRILFKTPRDQEGNQLTFRIQPREGLEFDLWVKKPGYDNDLARLPLDFTYERYFGADLPDAYEQVIIDAMRGRPELFASSDEILATWALLEPIRRRWEMTGDDLKFYKKGSTYQQVLDQARV
jgi:glucose-6-phosphate 1-dehydrogenase